MDLHGMLTCWCTRAAYVLWGNSKCNLAPEEDRKLIYFSKACAPYVSVNCAFQIFTSVSWKFLKGIKWIWVTPFEASLDILATAFSLLRQQRSIPWPHWCPAVETFPDEFFRLQAGWLIKLLCDSFFPSSKLVSFVCIASCFHTNISVLEFLLLKINTSISSV